MRSTATPALGSVRDSGEVLPAARTVHDVRRLPVTLGAALAGVISDRNPKRALDPSPGLPSEDERFLEDVSESHLHVVRTWRVRSRTSLPPAAW